MIKKVNFFSLKASSQVDGNDLLEEGEDNDHFNIEAMNRSINKIGGGLKRNPKSFNFTNQQLNSLSLFVNNADASQDQQLATPKNLMSWN